ncbi:hypothetical protein [Synoicihabitans lomoniglobus]|uniref:Phage tail assembly protein n=1 Tax=Synoicihabitans lomoniglobus TaxID=2909285 RepID=A0AAE9ZX27_9BACT|nr:hypothetical protein [Opitutaceae bacterium LMO-M01]WED64480.1 hypothetical protein PXH66_19240 [Opitutaceae bacterium LMO-M01]
MEIRLLRLPFKFNTPDGEMEVTVRPNAAAGPKEKSGQYAAAAAFIGHGPRALERIRLTPLAATHSEVMKTLVTGFKINPEAHDPDTIDYRVLTALCTADGVHEVED